jgi:hypothetical protein
MLFFWWGWGGGERNAWNDISPESFIMFKERYMPHKMNGTNDYVLWEEKTRTKFFFL